MSRYQAPDSLIPGMAELGVSGPTIPEEYGGAGLDYLAYGTMMQELESVVTYEGTHDIHLLITGMDITGLNAFS